MRVQPQSLTQLGAHSTCQCLLYLQYVPSSVQSCVPSAPVLPGTWVPPGSSIAWSGSEPEPGLELEPDDPDSRFQSLDPKKTLVVCTAPGAARPPFFKIQICFTYSIVLTVFFGCLVFG